MNSDHRAVFCRILLDGRAIQRWRRKVFAKKAPGVGWKPMDVDAYKSMLDTKIQDINVERLLADRSVSLAEAFKQLETATVEIANVCNAASTLQSPSVHDASSNHVKQLCADRKLLSHSNGERAELSKQIKREFRKMLRQRQDAKLSDIIENFKGLNKIAKIRNNGKIQHLTSIRSKDGTMVDDRVGIVNVFADFYADLYTSRQQSSHDGTGLFGADLQRSDVADISLKELRDQLQSMKKGKAGDKSGIVIEMLQLAGDSVLECIAYLFNEVLFSCEAPGNWKESCIAVLFKKGDTALPENYRPITLLPILYKLFSRVIWGRVRSNLEAA